MNFAFNLLLSNCFLRQHNGKICAIPVTYSALSQLTQRFVYINTVFRNRQKISFVFNEAFDHCAVLRNEFSPTLILSLACFLILISYVTSILFVFRFFISRFHAFTCTIVGRFQVPILILHKSRCV